MDISVIVPIYGVEIYIERCLRSLFNQTKSDGVEYILVNDCTPDRSMEIAREVIAEFPHLDIKILEHSENRKLAAARQTGFDIATGEYVIHIDSDDWCEPTMLADMFAKAKVDDADIVMADYYDKDGIHARSVEESNPKRCVDSLLLMNKHKSKWLVCVVWNKLVRRRLYIENSISCNNGINYSEDVILSLYLLWHSKIISYVSTPYLHYTCNTSSMTSARVDYIFDRVTIMRLITDFITEQGAYDLYKDKLIYMKLSLKEMLVKTTRGELQQMIVKELPEVDDKILLESSFTWGSRIALYLATHGCRPIANLIYNIVGVIKPHTTIQY